MSTPLDVQGYYRQITGTDIGTLSRELLGGSVTQESAETLFCDCPNHGSQSHRSLHIWLDKQGWYCFGCGIGGDALQLVEFVHSGTVTRGLTGVISESHRQARDFLAARAGLPPLSQVGRSPEQIAQAEEEHQLTWRVRGALTALSEIYHQRLVAHAEVLAWFKSKYGIGDETIARLKIGFAENEPSPVRALTEGAGAFTPRELAGSSAFRPTSQDGLIPAFEGRIVFPYWSRGNVVFMIGRRTPWTPDQEWEKSKYKKLAVRNDRNNEHVALCVQNDVLYNEDVLLARPERVIITEGVTDCISLMEHGFPVVSPVTVQIREADWERLLPRLAGVKTVFLCQDNEVSEAGMRGALKTARILAANGITTRVAVLPLGERQLAAREKLAVLPAGSAEADALLAEAKIDVNEFFASGKTAADFEQLLEVAQTPLEMAIAALSSDMPNGELARILGPLLAEVGQLDPIAQPSLLKQIQEKCGKERLPITALRKQMKVVRIDSKKKPGGKQAGSGRSSGTRLAVAAEPSAEWRDHLIACLSGSPKALLANAITALREAPEWHGVLAYDEFSHITTLRKPAPWMNPNAVLRSWSAIDDILATDWMQHQDICVASDVTSRAVEAVARENGFHPVTTFLQDLEWDHEPRIDSWLTDYLGAEPSPYTSAVGSRWMISAVARVFEPGCKVDCCLILEGEQGIKKSTALRTLAHPWFTDEIANLGSKDAAIQARGVWIVELAELESLSRSEVGSAKAFISRGVDRFRPVYGERSIDSPRQCVFAGSVNHSAYLQDDTGARRFWPVACKAPVIDVEGLTAVRDQLWAEATFLYFEGKNWWLDSKSLQVDAAAEQLDRYDEDVWTGLVINWADNRESVSIAEVLGSCIEKKKDAWTQWDKIRVARCLRAQGWERFKARDGYVREWRYRKAL